MCRRTSFGNCLIGALWLCVRLRTWRLRMRIEDRLPHFYVLDADGYANFFRYVDDANGVGKVRWWLWYRGRFVRVPEGRL